MWSYTGHDNVTECQHIWVDMESSVFWSVHKISIHATENMDGAFPDKIYFCYYEGHKTGIELLRPVWSDMQPLWISLFRLFWQLSTASSWTPHHGRSWNTMPDHEMICEYSRVTLLLLRERIRAKWTTAFFKVVIHVTTRKLLKSTWSMALTFDKNKCL